MSAISGIVLHNSQSTFTSINGGADEGKALANFRLLIQRLKLPQHEAE
jgi:hypothetical protein